MQKFFAQAAISLSLFSFLFTPSCQAAPQLKPRATVCNGFSELCSRSYGNVTFVGAHDSFAVGSGSAANQDYNVTRQLTDGIRMLQNQAHTATSGSAIELCHTSCVLLDGGTLENYLTSVKSWMDDNPTEVVTLLLVNSDDLAPSAFDAVYKAVGLDTMSYSPPTSSITNLAWPTLGEMIDNGTRLVTFMDTDANFASVPYIIDEFTNMWETVFDVTTEFDCNVNRSNASPASTLMTINHFLDNTSSISGFDVLNPDKAELPVTNAASGTGSLGDQASQCQAQWGRAPNFMLVDFYEYGAGSVFQVAADLNGVSYAPSTPIAPTPSSTSGSGGGASETSTPLNGARGLGIEGSWVATVAVAMGILLGVWTIA